MSRVTESPDVGKHGVVQTMARWPTPDLPYRHGGYATDRLRDAFFYLSTPPRRNQATARTLNPSTYQALKKRRAHCRRGGASVISIRCGRDYRLARRDHARLDEDASLLVRDRHVEQLGEHVALDLRELAQAIHLSRLHAVRVRGRSATLRVAFDQGDIAFLEQLFVLRAQVPAGRRMVFQAGAQALVKQNVRLQRGTVQRKPS